LEQQASSPTFWDLEEGDRFLRAGFGKGRAADLAGNAILKRATAMVYEFSRKSDGVSPASIQSVTGAEADLSHVRRSGYWTGFPR
jgi:hypothetical protein